MTNIGTKRLTFLIFAIGLVSWYGTAVGFSQFSTSGRSEGDSGLSILALAIIVTASALVQSLMAVFLTISLSAYVVHIRTRALYLFGFAIAAAISAVLAIAFWANFMSLPEAQAELVVTSNREVAIESAKENLVLVARLHDSVAESQATAEQNSSIEARTGLGDRHAHWTQLSNGLELLRIELATLKRDLQAGVEAAGSAKSSVEIQDALGLPIAAVEGSNVAVSLQGLIERAVARDSGLSDGGGHRQRWDGFLPNLEALKLEAAQFVPIAMGELEENDFGGDNGDKAYALNVAQKFVTGEALTNQERIAVSLAITVDLIFAILLILRNESRRPDQDPDLIYHYTPAVETLNARLRRNGLEKGVSGVVETLLTNGKGLFGFDRLFGLVISLPDSNSKSQLGQTVAFLKSDGMAVDVSGLAMLFTFTAAGGSIRECEATQAKKRQAVTVLIPPAQWRLINRLKHVEDLMPEPEDKGTLAEFVRKQRRSKPRVYTVTKLKTLDTYFGSAMEASLNELVPGRIERIVDAFRSDPRTKRLARKTKEKHESTFRDVIDAARTEGLLPPTGAHLRVAG